MPPGLTYTVLRGPLPWKFSPLASMMRLSSRPPSLPFATISHFPYFDSSVLLLLSSCCPLMDSRLPCRGSRSLVDRALFPGAVAHTGSACPVMRLAGAPDKRAMPLSFPRLLSVLPSRKEAACCSLTTWAWGRPSKPFASRPFTRRSGRS